MAQSRPFLSFFFLLFLFFLPFSFGFEHNHNHHNHEDFEVTSRARARTRLVFEKTNKARTKIEQLREMKKKGIVMEKDGEALSLISSLQHDLQHLLRLRFGKNVEEIQLELTLSFPSTMPDYSQQGSEGKIVIQLADYNLVPYTVYYFLELVKHFQSADFRRNAGHVLQAKMTLKDSSGSDADHVRKLTEGMAFQEYHPENPHKKYTLGFAGRPGGPEFYINIVDNTRNHGPGSQGSKTEADGCFGKVIQGEDVVERIKKQPGAQGMGFVQQLHFIHIESITLLTPDG